MRIARRSADPFVRLAAGGATIWLCGQAVINIGYVTGLLPVTGIPLPFISAGGTSLLVTFFVLGMLVSFARHEPAAVAAARRAQRRDRRTRLERWARIPVPAGVSTAQARRSRRGRRRGARPPRPQAPRAHARPGRAAAAGARAASPRPARRRTGAPTGTDGSRAR